MDKYIVYKHTAPNGKVYIGITKRKAEERWLGGIKAQAKQRMRKGGITIFVGWGIY